MNTNEGTKVEDGVLGMHAAGDSAEEPFLSTEIRIGPVEKQGSQCAHTYGNVDAIAADGLADSSHTYEPQRPARGCSVRC